MNNVVFPKGPAEVVRELIERYRSDLVEATAATENALRQLRQQLAQMERNQIAILAQKALLDTFEKDFAAKEVEDATPTPTAGT